MRVSNLHLEGKNNNVYTLSYTQSVGGNVENVKVTGVSYSEDVTDIAADLIRQQKDQEAKTLINAVFYGERAIMEYLKYPGPENN